MMRSAAVGALCLAAGASAFRGTAPLLIWEDDGFGGSVKNVQSALSSSAPPASEAYGELRRLGCDWSKVAVVHVKELHHSRVPALTLPKPHLSIPYLTHPDRFELDASLGEWADLCGASLVGESEVGSVGADQPMIVHYNMDASDVKLPIANLVILTSTASPSPSPPSGQTPPRHNTRKSKAALKRISDLSARLHLKPKAKRSKYVSAGSLAERQSLDLENLEQGLESELEALKAAMHDVEEEFGFEFENNDGESDANAKGQDGQGEGEGEEDNRQTLQRPEEIDDDSAYADAPEPSLSSGDGSDDFGSEYQYGYGQHQTQDPSPSDGPNRGNSTVDPHAPLLDRIQLFTTPLLTALLVSFLIFIPVIMLGIQSLAGIQVPPRMMEISKGAQVSKEKKEQ